MCDFFIYCVTIILLYTVIVRRCIIYWLRNTWSKPLKSFAITNIEARCEMRTICRYIKSGADTEYISFQAVSHLITLTEIMERKILHKTILVYFFKGRKECHNKKLDLTFLR